MGDSIKVAEARLTKIAVLKTHIINYAKTREVYTAYRKTGYSKAFLEAHREENTLHKAAKDEGLPTVAIESQAAGTPIVVSTAVTEEIDMGMGLVTRVSLDESMDVWIEAIKRAADMEIPTVEDRIKQIDSLFFTASSAANCIPHL